MKSLAVLGLSVLLSTLSANAQQAANNCPVAMSAKQSGGLHIEHARYGQTPQQPAMTPSLTLRSPRQDVILSATITAHGYSASPKGGTLLSTQAKTADTRQQITKTLTVKFQPEADGSVTGEFRLPGFIVLESIELSSLTYANGSVWNLTSSTGCRVKPDSLMLVAGK